MSVSENNLEGDVGDIVSLQAQIFPYFQLRKKFKNVKNIQTKVKSSIKP